MTCMCIPPSYTASSIYLSYWSPWCQENNIYIYTYDRFVGCVKARSGISGWAGISGIIYSSKPLRCAQSDVKNSTILSSSEWLESKSKHLSRHQASMHLGSHIAQNLGGAVPLNPVPLKGSQRVETLGDFERSSAGFHLTTTIQSAWGAKL